MSIPEGRRLSAASPPCADAKPSSVNEATLGSPSTDLGPVIEKPMSFKMRVYNLLRHIQVEGYEFSGEDYDYCDECGSVSGESCCPSCRLGHGNKLGGIIQHYHDCELAALMKECLKRD